MPTFYCLCFNAFNSKTFSHLSTSRRTAPAPTRHVRPRHAHAHALPVRPAAPRPRPCPRPRPRPGLVTRASVRARVVHRPPLTGFTRGVHKVHPLSRLRSSSNFDTGFHYRLTHVGFKTNSIDALSITFRERPFVN